MLGRRSQQIKIIEKTVNGKFEIDSNMMNLLGCTKENFYKFKDPKNLEKVTRVFFSHRRKMLKKPFNQLFNGDQKILDKLKIDLNLRPQNLDFELDVPFYHIQQCTPPRLLKRLSSGTYHFLYCLFIVIPK